MSPQFASPYTMEEQPTSVGRVLLARAFAHWCALHHGHSAEEVAAALDRDGEIDASARQEVHLAARLLGQLLAAGLMKAWARPFGGGTPVVLPPSDWELDDFRLRMERSAIDPARPFGPGAEPTHWIFVDLEDFNRIVDDSCGAVGQAHPVPRDKSVQSRTAPSAQAADTAFRAADRLIRMPEVKRRTGMSASTVYRRIDQERFPRQVPMDAGNIAAWWESEVDEWIARPR